MLENQEKIYAGIDVSKENLDVCFGSKKEVFTYKNSPQGIKMLLKRLNKTPNIHVVLEATGGYEHLVHQTLLTDNIYSSIVNPGLVRHFAKSKNILAKTDRIDAYIIWWFACENHPTPAALPNEKEQALTLLRNRREQLVSHLQREKQHHESLSLLGKHTLVAKSFKKVMKLLEKEILNIEHEISEIIKEDEEFSRKSEVITSFKGVGSLTALTILCDLNELGKIQDKPLTALVGLAPFNHESGKYKGKQRIRGGRARVRKALYLCALSAKRYNPRIKAFYERLIANGKSKKAAIIACARKILIILNAMVRSNCAWVSDYRASI